MTLEGFARPVTGRIIPKRLADIGQYPSPLDSLAETRRPAGVTLGILSLMDHSRWFAQGPDSRPERGDGGDILSTFGLGLQRGGVGRGGRIWLRLA
jgi:hypothetical protein